METIGLMLICFGFILLLLGVGSYFFEFVSVNIFNSIPTPNGFNNPVILAYGLMSFIGGLLLFIFSCWNEDKKLKS